MKLDIRTPIGAMFAVLGLILGIYGLVTLGQPDVYARSMGLNVNLWWGLIMLAFGLTMFALGRRATARASRNTAATTAVDQPALAKPADPHPSHTHAA